MSRLMTGIGTKHFRKVRWKITSLPGLSWVFILLFSITLSVRADQSAEPTSSVDYDKLIQSQITILKASGTPLSTRKVAVALLMDLEIPRAKEQLLRTLADPSDKQARLAILETVADRDEPGPEFIEPLIDILLNGDADLQKASTGALGRYRNDELTEKLIRIAGDSKNYAVRQRAAAIEALGKVRTKRTVEALLNILSAALTVPEEQRDIGSACAKSLYELTRFNFGTNIEAWKHWWERNKDKSVAQWLESQLDVLLNENSELRRRLEQTEEALAEESGRLFRAGSPNEADRVRMVQGHLSRPLASQRRIGLELLATFISPRQEIPAALQPTVRDLIADSDPHVRRICARILGESGDQQAIDPMLKQFEVETSPAVKQALLVAMGQLGDKEILDLLIETLNSPIEEVSKGAIQAISKIFQNQKKIPSAQRDQTVQALLKRYQQADPDQVQLKQEMLIAMGTICDYRFTQLFKQELSSLHPELRLYSARGLAGQRDEKLVAVLTQQLNDPEAGIRAELAGGIASLTSEPQVVDELLNRVNPNIEKDNQVRQSNWNAILTMIKRWPVDNQIIWVSTKVLTQNNPVNTDQLSALIDAIAAQITEQSPSWMPEQQVRIMLEFGKSLLQTPRPDESVKYFRQAISSSRQISGDKPTQIAEGLLEQFFQLAVPDTILSQFLNGLSDLLEPEQLDTIIEGFIQWSQHSANSATAGKVSGRLSSELLNHISDAHRTQLDELTKTHGPTTQPSTQPAS